MSSPADAVNRWIAAFRAVWTACGSVNTIVKQVTWNPFANATMGTYLKSQGAQTAFLSELQQQFTNNGLSGVSILQIITSTDTFFTYTTNNLGELWPSVVDLIAGYCPPGPPCFSSGPSSNDLVWTTPLLTAFLGGAADQNWTGLMNAVKSSNLDNLIQPKALATASAQLVKPAATIQDLINTLSTI